MILKRMKRRHLREDAIRFCREVRDLRPDIAFGADLIAGFPTESEEMFANSLALVEECGLTFLHVFPFSARVGTPAARMPQLAGPVRKERAARLRAAGQQALGRYLSSRIGAATRLLVLVPGLPRLRLSSIDVVEVDADLKRLIAEEPRLMPHLHLSLQAGDDMILKRMKRRHLRDDAIRFCREVRDLRPDIVLGADLIAGFPTESEGMFANSLALVDECGLTFLHVFPFSARVGTPAARMPQLAGPVRKERAARLRAAGQQALGRYLLSRVGAETRLLVERSEDGEAFGHNDHFAPVRLKGSALQGTIVDAHVTAATEDHLIAA
jgi:tRNA A37 methylthiotransferase MiaB